MSHGSEGGLQKKCHVLLNGLKLLVQVLKVAVRSGLTVYPTHRRKIDYLDWTSADYPDGQKKLSAWQDL